VNTSENNAQIFEQYRWLLFSIAYRLLGSATDAEDIVQEAFVRWLQAGTDEVQSPKAYLSTVVVRLCLDQLRSAQARREVYVGPWLPEPIATGPRHELADTAILAESLSFAFLIMLESLKPLERAVFLLREVFDYDYAEIAEIVGKTPVYCRQVLHRARAHLGQRRARRAVSREQQERVTAQFIRASTSGDVQGLLAVLTEDVVFTGDSGGKAPTARVPVQGADKVVRGTLGSLQKWYAGAEGRVIEVNGQPAIVGYMDGHPVGVILLDIGEDGVRHVYTVVNPDKLRWLDPPPA